jgi:hypothetical protein
MALFENAQLSFDAWMNSLDAADSAALGAVGFGLMIFAVAALLIQRHLEQRKQKIRRSIPNRPMRPVPGLRYSRAETVEIKTSWFLMKSKKDPFLSRLERLA